MRRRSTWMFPVCVFGVLCLCFAGQRLLYDHLERYHARFVAENPYFITLGRLQDVARLKGDVVILGSSMTERLQSSDDVAVIGVPGSSFLGGLQFLKECRFKPGTVAVVEGNLIMEGVNSDVMRDTEKWTFQAFRGNKHFSIRSKPSSLLLSYFYLLLQPNAGEDSPGACFNEDGFQPRCEVDSAGTMQHSARVDAVVRGIRVLKDMGFEPCIAWYPTRLVENAAVRLQRQASLEAAARENVPFLDYSAAPFKAQLPFTDMHHLKSTARETRIFRNTIARDARRAVREK